MKLELSRQAFDNIQISSFMKIRPIGAELSHAVGRKGGRTDGEIDATKLSRFSKLFEGV